MTSSSSTESSNSLSPRPRTRTMTANTKTNRAVLSAPSSPRSITSNPHEPSFAQLISPILHKSYHEPSFEHLARTLLPYSPRSPTATFTYQRVFSVLKMGGQVLCAVFSGGLLYVGFEKDGLRLWKLPEFIECDQLKSSTKMVVAVEVCNDMVYAAYGDFKIRIWRRIGVNSTSHVCIGIIPKRNGYIIRKRPTAMQSKHAGQITSLAVNLKEDILYTASQDSTVKVWQLSDLKCIETINAHHEPINAIVVAEDDGTLYTASNDATVKAWSPNFSTKQPHSLSATLSTQCSPVRALTLSHVGNTLYGGCTDGYIHYWVIGWFSCQLQYVGALQGHTHAVMCLANVSDFVVSGSADMTCRVWLRKDDNQHICLAVLKGHRGPVKCVTAFLEQDSDEGCTVSTGGLDGVLKVWRVSSE